MHSLWVDVHARIGRMKKDTRMPCNLNESNILFIAIFIHIFAGEFPQWASRNRMANIETKAACSPSHYVLKQAAASQNNKSTMCCVAFPGIKLFWEFLIPSQQRRQGKNLNFFLEIYNKKILCELIKAHVERHSWNPQREWKKVKREHT